jgi:RNA polymerase sigma-70 factor (ECF subfamily)
MSTPVHEGERPSQIVARWALLLEARRAAGPVAREDRVELLPRYGRAVYRYLRRHVGDRRDAVELCQEFAVRFLRGDFRRADPQRGRFRDYVKSALVNLVNDHHRSRQARPRPLAAGAAEPAAPAEPSLPSDADFLSGWRQELLNQTWTALADANPAYHAALLLRIEDPDLPSPAMAVQLAERLGRPLTPENVRKLLQRAHAKFAELLLDQVAASLTDPTADELEDELRAVDVLKYCRSALERRRGR